MEPLNDSVVTQAAQSIREWIEAITPCHCDPVYSERGLEQPDCTMHELIRDADAEARDLREEGLLRDA